VKRKITFGVITGGLSIVISSLSGIIIYPLLLNSVSKEIAGLWLFYTSLSVILNLGQAGLAPVVMRRAAALKMNGSKDDYDYFYFLIQKSYTIASLIVFLICVIIYFGYVHWVLLDNHFLFNEGLITWCLFTFGNIVNIYYSRNFYTLNGLGEVGLDKITQIVITLFTIFGYFLILKYHFGLVGLGFVFLLSNLIFAFFSKLMLAKFVVFSHGRGIRLERSEIKNIFREGGSILILNIVGILVLNKDIFLVERYMGLRLLPAFSALSRVQGILVTVSLLIPQMFFPYISQAFSNRDFIQARKLYLTGVILSICFAIFMCFIIMFVANDFFTLWLGKGNYLGNSILFMLFCLAILTIHHNAHASAVISTGGNSFVYPAVINALLSVPLSIIGIKYFGIQGMLIGNFAATLLPSIYVVYFSLMYFNKSILSNGES
jgi:O-antigen/teichoic acid export membrane protein